MYTYGPKREYCLRPKIISYKYNDSALYNDSDKKKNENIIEEYIKIKTDIVVVMVGLFALDTLFSSSRWVIFFLTTMNLHVKRCFKSMNIKYILANDDK